MTFANGISLPSTLAMLSSLAWPRCCRREAEHDNDETHYRAINLVSDIAGVRAGPGYQPGERLGDFVSRYVCVLVSDNGTG